MTFRELIEQLAKRIGQHQLPINTSATELRGFIETGAVHYGLVSQVVIAIYSGNRCRRLTDPVTRDASFESIEPIRLTVLRSPKTDVDAYVLMESMCAEVAHVFNTSQPLVSPANTSKTAHGQLYAFRRRLRLS
ncbi:MAG: hypothetical protein AAB304_05625 [Pseudomonadota bacterium]